LICNQGVTGSIPVAGTNKINDLVESRVAIVEVGVTSGVTPRQVSTIRSRFRAERRIGELRQAQADTVGLNTGTAGTGNANVITCGSRSDPPVDKRPTLAEAGIDKHLADRARKYAAVPDKEFETPEVVGRVIVWK
jgi:hypothetical protein